MSKETRLHIACRAGVSRTSTWVAPLVVCHVSRYWWYTLPPSRRCYKHATCQNFAESRNIGGVAHRLLWRHMSKSCGTTSLCLERKGFPDQTTWRFLEVPRHHARCTLRVRVSSWFSKWHNFFIWYLFFTFFIFSEITRRDLQLSFRSQQLVLTLSNFIFLIGLEF